jgi:hypothetical protein
MLCLRQLVAGLKLWWVGGELDRRPGNVRFMVNKMVMWPFFLRVPRCYPGTVIPPVQHTRPLLRAALTTRKNGRSLGTSQNETLFRKSGSIGSKSTGTVFDLRLGNVRFVISNVDMGKTCLPALRFPCRCHFTNASYSSSSTCWPYQKDKNSALSEIGKHLIKKNAFT